MSEGRGRSWMPSSGCAGALAKKDDFAAEMDELVNVAVEGVGVAVADVTETAEEEGGARRGDVATGAEEEGERGGVKNCDSTL
jgi:hypothetical protein